MAVAIDAKMTGPCFETDSCKRKERERMTEVAVFNRETKRVDLNAIGSLACAKMLELYCTVRRNSNTVRSLLFKVSLNETRCLCIKSLQHLEQRD